MQDIINRVAQNVGIDAATAKPAIGMVLNLLKSVLPAETLNSVLSAVPGASDLMTSAEQSGSSGGIGGMLGGALGSLTGGSGGAVMETLGKLQGLGLSTDQSKGVGNEVLGFIKENAPADVTSTIEQHLPDLSA